MNHSNDILNDLVSTARDGQEFYEHAATKVKDPQLKTLFKRIARVKSDIVQGLSNEVRSSGDEPATSGTWHGDFNRFYGEVRAMLGRKDFAYVAQLEESEDQLVKAFDRAMNSEETTPHARSVIAAFLPEVRECHDTMRQRKIQLKHAA
jgi:uncharacterized protein (TIGR02284 family)